MRIDDDDDDDGDGDDEDEDEDADVERRIDSGTCNIFAPHLPRACESHWLRLFVRLEI